MKITNEVEFWLWLRNRLDAAGGHIQRVENSEVNGMPDVVVCRCALTTWLELKVETRGEVLLRKEQYAWGVRHAHNGGRVLVVAYIPSSDMIDVWSYKNIDVEPWGNSAKYVKITNPAKYASDRSLWALDNTLALLI